MIVTSTLSFTIIPKKISQFDYNPFEKYDELNSDRSAGADSGNIKDIKDEKMRRG